MEGFGAKAIAVLSEAFPRLYDLVVDLVGVFREAGGGLKGFAAIAKVAAVSIKSAVAGIASYLIPVLALAGAAWFTYANSAEAANAKVEKAKEKLSESTSGVMGIHTPKCQA